MRISLMQVLTKNKANITFTLQKLHVPLAGHEDFLSQRVKWVHFDPFVINETLLNKK